MQPIDEPPRRPAGARPTGDARMTSGDPERQSVDDKPEPWFIRQARDGEIGGPISDLAADRLADRAAPSPFRRPDLEALPVIRKIGDVSDAVLDAQARSSPPPFARDEPSAASGAVGNPRRAQPLRGAGPSRRLLLGLGGVLALSLAGATGWLLRGDVAPPSQVFVAAPPTVREIDPPLAPPAVAAAPPLAMPASDNAPAQPTITETDEVVVPVSVAATAQATRSAKLPVSAAANRKLPQAPQPTAGVPRSAKNAEAVEARRPPATSRARELSGTAVAGAPPPLRLVGASQCTGTLSAGARIVCASPNLLKIDADIVRVAVRVAATGDRQALQKLSKYNVRYVTRRDRCKTRACVLDKLEDRLEATQRLERRTAKRLDRRGKRALAATSGSTLPECKSSRPTTPCAVRPSSRR